LLLLSLSQINRNGVLRVEFRFAGLRHNFRMQPTSFVGG